MNLLRWTGVHEKVALSRPTIWRLETAGKFPRRRRLTANVVAWSEAEIDQWIKTREVGMGRAPGVKRDA